VRSGAPWIYAFRSEESANRALVLFGGEPRWPHRASLTQLGMEHANSVRND
jgi:hypothetical protein